MKRVLKYALILTGIAIAGLFLLAVMFSGDPEILGGMSSRHRPIDYDPELTPIAREAASLIAAVNDFIAVHGACPHANPRDLAELDVKLHGGFEGIIRGEQIYFRKPNAVVDWVYSASGQDAVYCMLWRKLGWDPSLNWIRYRDDTRWIFSPGDGSEGIVIKLDGD